MRDHYAGGYYAKIVISRCAWFNDRRDLRVGARPRRAELFIEERRGGWGREDIVIVILVRQEDWLNYILELYAIVGERNKWKREISLQSSSRIEVLQVQESKILNRENSFGEWRNFVTLNILFVLSGYLNRLPRYEGSRDCVWRIVTYIFSWNRARCVLLRIWLRRFSRNRGLPLVCNLG